MKSAKEATFFKNFNADLAYLSMLYERVKNRHTERKEYTEKQFRLFLKRRFRKSRGDEDTDSSDSDGEPFFSNHLHARRRRRMRWREWHERPIVAKEMVEDPEKAISALLDSFNNITEETTQLIEVKDIIDELKMIHEVQDEQMRVLGDFTKALNRFVLKDEIQKPPREQSLKTDVQKSELEDETQKGSVEQLVKNGEDQLSEIQDETQHSMEQFLKNGKEQCSEMLTLSKKAKDILDAVIIRRKCLLALLFLLSTD
jgi:flagellar hook-basal body complex protein FliE